jgi:hypothetical protein
MIKKRKKGQGAIEFIIILGVVMVFFVVFFAIIRGNQMQKYKDKEDKIFESIALDVRDEINIAAGASDGYHREFSIPDSVYGKDYSIVITDIGYIYLTSEKYAVSFKASKVNGTINKGMNIIRVENETVYLN